MRKTIVYFAAGCEMSMLSTDRDELVRMIKEYVVKPEIRQVEVESD